ncbi:unnamed protein product [Caenorhabditis auriculariae]|uniref:Uncharacterized protein n=1 Tax=Caenorhabditis auriculariae TaxID=2777116 RepID=A0A8S1GSN5_9PELO|nr:unnamed protein product [Caenorhabditis auriculariae]
MLGSSEDQASRASMTKTYSAAHICHAYSTASAAPRRQTFGVFVILAKCFHYSQDPKNILTSPEDAYLKGEECPLLARRSSAEGVEGGPYQAS